MLKNPAVPLFAALLGLLSFWFALESDPGDFVNNMLPELIGFCLEGIFFVGIFTFLQERKDQDRKQRLRESLAGAVGFICPIINGCLPVKAQIRLDTKENWTRQTRLNGKRLASLFQAINRNSIDVSSNEIEAIQKLLQTRLSTLDSLLAIAAEISHGHLSAYTMMLTEIHKIAEHHYFDSKELEQSFQNLMRLLVSFNTEPL